MAYTRNNVNMDNWDPMAESYYDPNINSYEHGPGINLAPYTRNPANIEYRLHISGIPLELSENGLRQIFNAYGETTGVMSPANSTWGFVSYRTFREAEYAIRELDKRAPLNLTVKFAKQNEEGPNRLQKIVPHLNPVMEPIPRSAPVENPHREYISPEQRPQVHRPFVDNLGRGQQLVDLARRTIAPPSGLMYNENEDLLYPAVHDPKVYNLYEDAEPFADTNNMWTRRKLQVSDDGTRYVTMGRGYTWYQLPTPHPKVNQQIRSVYENRQAGLYEYGEPKFSQHIGKCQNCAQQAVMRCKHCREFYCSRVCQETDWPRHKIQCQIALPPLEGGANSVALSMSSGEDMVPIKEPKKRSIRRMRRPFKPNTIPMAKTFNPLATSELKEQENVPVTSLDNLKCGASGDRKRIAEQNNLPNQGGWNPMKNGTEQKPLCNRNDQGEAYHIIPNTNFLNYPPPSIAKQNNEAKQETHSDDKNSNRKKPVGFNQCEGGQTNRNFFKSECPNLVLHTNQQHIMEQVKDLNIQDTQPPRPESKSNPLLVDPDVGFYTTAEIPQPSNVKSPPKVSFQDKKSDEATAKPLRNETVAGDIKNQIKPKQEMKNVVELLENEEEGCFEVHVILGGKKAAVTICLLKIQNHYEKLMSQLTPECNKLVENVPLKPEIGELVCGRRQDDWIRGTLVSSVPPMRLAAIDEGRVEVVTELKNIPDDYKNLTTLGAICEITQGDIKLEPSSQCTFLVVDNNSGKALTDGVEIVVFVDEKEARGVLKPWTPAPEQKGIPYATLTSGTEVYLVSFRSHCLIFARSLVPKDIEVFNRVTQDVARWSTEASTMRELPVEGEMVIAKYLEDENFYRAIVRKVNGNEITVSYVDFGNIEKTSVENIKPISEKLKEYPSCVARVVLKDVPNNVPMNKEVHEFLGELAGRETPLMCTFEGSPQNGVILKKADGTILNKKIKELLTPSWKQPEEFQDKTTVYTVEDLEVAELGKVGETLNVLTLFSYGPNLHAMAPQDRELITHVTGIMAGQMEAYCNQVKDHYIPRQNELCLAPYNGVWYRALCLDPNASSTTSTVNFVDFGNVETVDHADLRVITKDFMTTKTLASICTVVGLGPVDEDGELPQAVGSRVTELLPLNAPTCIKIVECSRNGEYTIELPEVKEILLKEGLLTL